MNTIRIYIEENLDVSHQQKLKRLIQELPHVLDVELSEMEPHEVVVEYEERNNIPLTLLKTLRRQGYHPDILSA